MCACATIIHECQLRRIVTFYQYDLHLVLMIWTPILTNGPKTVALKIYILK